MAQKLTLKQTILKNHCKTTLTDLKYNMYATSLKALEDNIVRKKLNDKYQYKGLVALCKDRKERHALQQLKYRLNNAETIRLQNKHFNDKRTCKHLIAHTEVNPNRDSINLVCGRCGVLMAKTGF